MACSGFINFRIALDPVVQKADSRSQESRADFCAYVSCLVSTPRSSLFFDPVRSAAEENAWLLSEQNDEQPVPGQHTQQHRSSSTSIKPGKRESQTQSMLYERGDWEHESNTASKQSPEELHTSKAPLDTESMLVRQQIHQPLGLRLSTGEALPSSAPLSAATASYQYEGQPETSNTADVATKHKKTSRYTRHLSQRSTSPKPREDMHHSCSTAPESAQTIQ